MSQSNGKGLLKRFEFEFAGNSYYFTLNPEDYQQVEPSRSTVTQTLGGAWIDAFGAGMLEFSIRGTTGFKNGTGEADNGFEKYKELRDLIRSVYVNVTSGQVVTEVLKFYNYTDEEYWETYPERFSLTRSKSKPLLYMYDIKLIGLRKISEGKAYGGRVGNPFPISDTTIMATDAGYTGGIVEVNSTVNLFPHIRDDITIGAVTSISQYKSEETSSASSSLLDTSVSLLTLQNNVSELIGGTNGLFSPAVSSFVTNGITILDTCTISNLQDTATITRGTVSLNYRPQVSRGSYILYKELKNMNVSFMETNKFMGLVSDYVTSSKLRGNIIQIASIVALIANQEDKAIDSTLVKALKEEQTKIQVVDIKRLKGIIIDSMGVYSGLVSANSGTTQELNYTEEELTRLTENIRYMSTKLESSDDVPYLFIKELRKLEGNMVGIKSFNSLFGTNRTASRNSFNQSKGV